MREENTIFVTLYESLKGSRMIGTELYLPDFGNQESLYVELLDEFLQILVAENVIKGNYYEWLNQKADSFHKQRLRNRNRKFSQEDFYDPFLTKSPEDYTTREQLTLIKHYLYKRVWSNPSVFKQDAV